jgi:hypothetical protein
MESEATEAAERCMSVGLCEFEVANGELHSCLVVEFFLVFHEFRCSRVAVSTVCAAQFSSTF